MTHPSHNPQSPGEKELSDQLHTKLDSLVRSLIKHDIDLKYARKELETAYIREVLKKHQGNIGAAAKALGVHRNTLSKHIKELKITVPKSS